MRDTHTRVVFVCLNEDLCPAGTNQRIVLSARHRKRDACRLVALRRRVLVAPLLHPRAARRAVAYHLRRQYKRVLEYLSRCGTR